MKLSQKYRLDELMKERERLRTSLGCSLGDEDIKVEIQGREVQGPMRQVYLAAIAKLYKADLESNTRKLTELGVEVDDHPVMPARRDE